MTWFKREPTLQETIEVALKKALLRLPQPTESWVEFIQRREEDPSRLISLANTFSKPSGDLLHFIAHIHKVRSDLREDIINGGGQTYYGVDITPYQRAALLTLDSILAYPELLASKLDQVPDELTALDKPETTSSNEDSDWPDLEP